MAGLGLGFLKMGPEPAGYIRIALISVTVADSKCHVLAGSQPVPSLTVYSLLEIMRVSLACDGPTTRKHTKPN